VEEHELRERKAPYAPISALREFLSKIRNVQVPNRVDKAFLQKLNVASNNEWALISALKYLGIVDDRGIPTSAYRRLLSDQTFTDTFRHLVERSYRSLLEMGGAGMSETDLQNYFRVTSSPSQAKTAARFFREVAHLAGLDEGTIRPLNDVDATEIRPEQATTSRPARIEDDREVLLAKARLVEKLPAPRSDWSASEYAAICESFVRMLESLDGRPAGG